MHDPAAAALPWVDPGGGGETQARRKGGKRRDTGEKEGSRGPQAEGREKAAGEEGYYMST
jgi:hypothetical protein